MSSKLHGKLQLLPWRNWNILWTSTTFLMVCAYNRVLRMLAILSFLHAFRCSSCKLTRQFYFGIWCMTQMYWTASTCQKPVLRGLYRLWAGICSPPLPPGPATAHTLTEAAPRSHWHTSTAWCEPCSFTAPYKLLAALIDKML